MSWPCPLGCAGFWGGVEGNILHICQNPEFPAAPHKGNIILTIFSFIPIKYIYLSRTEHISKSKAVKVFTFLFTMLAAVATFCAVIIYPMKTPSPLILIISAFTIFYILFSFKLNIKNSKA